MKISEGRASEIGTRVMLELNRLTPLTLLALLLGALVVTLAQAVEPTDSPGGAREALNKPVSMRLPNLSGTDSEGAKFSVKSLRGKRLLLLFFQPESPAAQPLIQAAKRLSALRSPHNFEMVGVGSGVPGEALRDWVRAQSFGFPIMYDGKSKLSAKVGLDQPAAVVQVDPDGYVVDSRMHLPGEGEHAADEIEEQLREMMRLPRARVSENLIERIAAPDFSSVALDGGEISLSAFRGKPVALIFFLHNCPHCHAALTTLKEQLAKLPEGKRPELVGVEISGQVTKIMESLASEKLDFFPVVVDTGWKLRTAYSVSGQVPVIFLIDAEGRIVYRTKSGWDAVRDPAIVSTWLATVAGAPPPMLLPEHGYSGSDLCGACHQTELAAWQLTSHASAYSTLVKHGAAENKECVGCHVVGFEKPGGFSLGQIAGPEHGDFEDVGCESCHGRGGPHLSPDFVSEKNYEPACAVCHDQKHSLGFEYASFAPRVSHARIAALSAKERQAMLAARGKPRAVLPSSAKFVGSNACQSCHETEYQTWAASPHAKAAHSLSAKQKDRDPDCQLCHTTGFDRPGGFPARAKPASLPDLASVGCESCHGPGADHVGENATRIGTIVSLTDKCDVCAILKVCGACHDEANDPGFGFEVEARIEAQRHGTIQPHALRSQAAEEPAAAPEPAAR